jgi:diguanylate cyclase (GGDEF)-like protein
MNTENKICRILIVDDEESLRIILSQVLTEDGHEVTIAKNGEEGLELFRKDPFQVVFTDIVMGNMSGLELLMEIKQIKPETQVIVITSHASLDTSITALRAGAYDYLIKPFDDLDMISNIAHRALEKLRLIKENKRLFSELKEKNAQLIAANIALKELAVRDGLTELYNHRYFQEALTVEVLRCNRHGRSFSLIFLDVDHFKKYNDINGHPAGDVALKLIGHQIGSRLRGSDILCRYGGEEFAVILPETSKEITCQIAETLRKQIEESAFEGEETQPGGNLTISLGIATYSQDGQDGSTLMEVVDRRLYKAKADGRNRCCCSD